jgi:DNA polymerase-1
MTTSESISTGRRHPKALCEECTLNEDSSIFVGSSNPGNCTLAIIGEAPGYQEARSGQCFSGPSGKLLDSVLREVGIDKETAFQTNAVLCRSRTNRAPSKSEIKCCWPRLQAELEEVNPNVILALGNAAAQGVLQTSEGVSSLRVGPPRRSELFNDAKVIATYHPAACLRQADFFPNLKADVKKINVAIDYWQEPTIVIWDDEASASTGLEGLVEQYNTFAIDIEVGIEKDTDFDHPERYQFLCIGIAADANTVYVIGEEALKSDKVKTALKPLLRCNLIAHNGKFDLAALKLIEPEARLWFDTMLSSYCLDERPGVHSLGYRAVEILGTPSWKDVLEPYVGSGKNRQSYANVPRDILYKYNALDVNCTWRLMEHDRQALRAENLEKLHQDYNDITMMLMHAETAGIRIDEEHFSNLQTTYKDELTRHEDFLSSWVNNPRSPKQVKEALASLGYNVESTNSLTLEVLMRKIKPESEAGSFIIGLQKQRKDQKLYSNYIVGLPEKVYEGRLHTNFLMHGTTSGRLATRDPNLLNVPRGQLIKSGFLPDEGCVFVQADYKTAELRVVAIESGDKELRAVLSDPTRDIHSEVAVERYGPNFTKTQRVRAKAVVFGVGYGREAHSIAIEYDMSRQEAQNVIDALFAKYPDIPAWQEYIRHRVTRQGEDLRNAFGRTRRFHLINKDNIDNIRRECLAFIPQSTANDCNMRAAALLFKESKLDIRLLVHDSILVNCKADEAVQIAEYIAQTMQRVAANEYSDLVPFYVDTSIGSNWGELA